MPGLDNKITNIIGTKIPTWLNNQLKYRSTQNSKDSRDDSNLIFLANKSSWVRLVSSIDIEDESDLKYFKDLVGENIKDKTSLAKEFVLFGGTSKYLNKNSYQQRSGLGKDGSYGTLGTSEIQKYGYKPMPGITNVNIDTQGRLGSIRAATVNFKCWDKNQLDIIDTLYFKLGFTMFLEWGHTTYYLSPENSQKERSDKVLSTELLSIDPFESNLNKEQIFFRLAENSRKSEGNYDGMLGIVTNFNFSYNQDGGYDCTIKLMSLGVLGDSIKINNSGTLPNLLEEEITQFNNTLAQIEADRRAREAAQNAINSVNSVSSEFPICITSLKGAQVISVSEEKLSGKGLPAKAFDSRAVFATVNNVGYYFYKNGKYQTTGLSASGSWSCQNNILYINGKTTSEDIYSYADIINKEQTPIRKESSLQENYYIIKNKGDYDYYAIDKFKNLLPINSNKEIIATLNIAAPEKLPSFVNSGNSFVDLLLNGLDKTKNNTHGFLKIGEKLFSPVNIYDKDKNGKPKPVTQDLGSGVGIIYRENGNLEETLIGSNEGYDIQIEYSGLNKKPYSVQLQYDYSAKSDVESPGGGWRLSYDKPSKEKEFQDAIKIAIVNPETQWKITSVKESAYTNSISTDRSTGTFVAETDVLVTKTETRPVKKGTDASGKEIYENVNKNINYHLNLKITFSDISIISSFSITDKSDLISPKDAVNPSKVKETIQEQDKKEAPPKEDPKNTGEKPDPTQVKQALTSQSSLELILRTIQVHALNKAINKNPKSPDLDIGKTVFNLKLYEDQKFLKQIFSNGIYSKFITELINDSVPTENYNQTSNAYDRFKIQSVYGFATNLMANKADVQELTKVNYKELMNAYAVPYLISQEIIKGTQTNHPVYMPLGLLLMILNHCCTIYDTYKESDIQTPLIYLDYNNELNFCLTNNKQLSTNPWKTLIPFQGTFQDYKELFEGVLEGDNIQAVSGSTNSTPLFNPEKEDALSGYLPTIKSESPYRGKIMNILLNIDYVVKLVQDNSYKDGSNNVYLKPFLEEILSDLNKYLGNFNSFRLSYNDQGNTFQIVDDQFIPGKTGETQVSPLERTDLPLQGKSSIAKSIEIKTDISTRLANMLAISANSTISNKSALSTNGDNFGFINTNYVDRYIKDKLQPTGSVNAKQLDTLKISAGQFNQSIKDFYSSINPSEGSVSHATNYYIEKMSRIKNDELPTRASALIPVSINFTTDGIGGLSMGQAFTVPEELLPYTYNTRKIEGLPKDYFNNIGFVVVGLTHNIQNNIWNTDVRANMIFLKNTNIFDGKINLLSPKPGLRFQGEGTNTGGGGTGGGGSCGCDKCYRGAYPMVWNDKKGEWDRQYSCAEQVDESESVNTSNFGNGKKYYGNYTFVKGTTDIDLSKAKLTPLKESEIVDDTTQNRFYIGTITSNPDERFFVVHHTAGSRGSASSVYNVFYGRGLPAQYVIDGDGTIHRFMPDGAKGWHASDYNEKSIGVEISALNNDDVTQAQVNSAVRLIHYLGFKKSQVKGHGEISSAKAATEGKKVVDLIRTL